MTLFNTGQFFGTPGVWQWHEPGIKDIWRPEIQKNMIDFRKETIALDETHKVRPAGFVSVDTEHDPPP
ncbi:MAG: hypothetical protein WCJ37_20510 [Syntrophus sp. (in: bacteria)]